MNLNVNTVEELVRRLASSEVAPCRVYFAKGDSFLLFEKVFRPVQEVASDSPTRIFHIDLECLYPPEAGFNAYFMKAIAQEVNRRGITFEDVHKITDRYQGEFEIQEKTDSIGINTIIRGGKERRLVRRSRTAEQIEMDYWECLKKVKGGGLRVIVIIRAIQAFMEEPEESNRFKQFVTKFVQQEVGSLVIGGNPESLSNLIVETHIPASAYEYLEFVRDSQEPRKELNEIRKQGKGPPPRDVLEAILAAFAEAPQHFRYFKFKRESEEFEGKQLPGLAKDKFDLAIFGHLQMRHDNPNTIRTNYDCVVLVRVLSEPVRDKGILLDFCYGAADIEGGVKGTSRKFEPWDTFLFIYAPILSESIRSSYTHQPYRNLFLLFQDGKFWNSSPHKWMDSILSDTSRFLRFIKPKPSVPHTPTPSPTDLSRVDDSLRSLQETTNATFIPEKLEDYRNKLANLATLTYQWDDTILNRIALTLDFINNHITLDAYLNPCIEYLNLIYGKGHSRTNERIRTDFSQILHDIYDDKRSETNPHIIHLLQKLHNYEVNYMIQLIKDSLSNWTITRFNAVNGTIDFSKVHQKDPSTFRSLRTYVDRKRQEFHTAGKSESLRRAEILYERIKGL